MGLNFIHKTAATHTTAWNAEFHKAAQDIFAAPCGVIDRTYLAPMYGKDLLKEGDCINVRLIEERVLVYKELQLAAEIDKPSMDLRESLNSCYGILPGQIDEVNDLAGVVSVHVGERSGK